MFSKNADPAAIDPAASPPLKSWSITERLTAHYVISAFVILTLSTILIYWGLLNSLERQSSRYLADEVSVTETILESAENEKELAKNFEVEYAAREFTKTYGRILDKNGRILLQTYKMGETIPVEAFPSPQKDDSNAKTIQWRSADGRSYKLRSVWVNLGGGDDTSEILQIALDISYLEMILEEYRLILAAAVIFGTFFSALAGLSIVRRGMLPLHEMEARTRHITASNLDERINLSRWPTELNALAVAFDEMLDRLKNSFDRLSSYVSNIAHELRTPVNILMGEAEVTLAKSRESSEYRKIIESSLEEYRRLSRIIDSLLFIARADVQKAQLALKEIDICVEIEKLKDYYFPIADEKNVKITCTGSALLVADAGLLRRALSNVLSNALQYTPGGGEITIDSRQAADGAMEVIVTDTGCGISEQELPNIFDRFYRVSGTRSMHPQGSGLGLSIVKSIMELHGGSITIHSQPSRGTSVILRFPSLKTSY